MFFQDLAAGSPPGPDGDHRRVLPGPCRSAPGPGGDYRHVFPDTPLGRIGPRQGLHPAHPLTKGDSASQA
eukprot:6497666-Heterocapsa_arctica.AAC.1